MQQKQWVMVGFVCFFLLSYKSAQNMAKRQAEAQGSCSLFINFLSIVCVFDQINKAQ
jgi:hypothetical protein